MLVRKVNSFSKDLLLGMRAGLLLKPFRGTFRFLSNFSELSVWISKHNKNLAFKDFYKPIRRYDDREKLHGHVSQLNDLKNKKIQYYEFGVAGGNSFRWWLNENKNQDSSFWGFDTFQGLPEDWHLFKKGDMYYDIPEIKDKRASFIKGLFQNTFFDFLKNNPPQTDVIKVIHMDADLFSSTLFILSSFAPYLKEGDIILFDEFNVPNHEFRAWDIFTKSFYVNYEVLGSVNNYYQTAIKYISIKAEL
jgi:O-methyltransferase